MSRQETSRTATDELRQRIADIQEDLIALARTVSVAAQDELKEMRQDTATLGEESRRKIHDVADFNNRLFNRAILVAMPARTVHRLSLFRS